MSRINRKVFSAEFFPPRSEAGRARFMQAAKALQPLHFDHVGVPFRAGDTAGSADLSSEGMLRSLQHLGYEVAPYLSCVATTKAEIAALLDSYQAQGIKRLVALRGDLPAGQGSSTGELRYASELVRFIREHSGEAFTIEVAAYPEMHPQAISLQADIRHFVHKVNH